MGFVPDISEKRSRPRPTGWEDHGLARGDGLLTRWWTSRNDLRPTVPGRTTRAGIHQSNGRMAFTLVEALISVGILGIFVAGCLTAIVIDQVSIRKAKEEAIVMDFLIKYVENIKALPFGSVAQGQPINSLYNGVSGAPLIVIPANTSWVALDTTNFQTFYPDLLWLSNRNPKMLVNLTQQSVAGSVHDKEIIVKVDWDAPLVRGGRLEVQVDFLRTVNVPTL